MGRRKERSEGMVANAQNGRHRVAREKAREERQQIRDAKLGDNSEQRRAGNETTRYVKRVHKQAPSVMKLHRMGWSPRKIAVRLDISAQVVKEILDQAG